MKNSTLLKIYESADQATQKKIRAELRKEGKSIRDLKDGKVNEVAKLTKVNEVKKVEVKKVKEALNSSKGGIVEIVFDRKEKKLRASFKGGWVRFPRHLRTEAGVCYYVEELIESKGGSYIAKGQIKAA